MTNTIDFILTTAASDLMSKTLGGKTLNFTRMAVGDGFSYDTTVAKGYKTLVNEVLSLDITKKETLSASSVKITSAFKNTDAQKEFYYREVGLYAQDPDTGEEVLYAYGNRNDAAELITPAGSSVITKQLAFIIAVGDSANVTFNVNADVYALQEDMVKTQADITMLNSTKADIITEFENNYEKMEHNANSLFPNSENYLDIPTYDGSGQTTHPKVLYVADGWNGYKFIMSHTPYPFENDDYENPSICVSNDGTTWSLINGCPDPIINTPPTDSGEGYNSDSHILIKDGVLELWYRECYGIKGKIKRTTTTDGVTWTTPQTIFEMFFTDILSPAIIYEDGKYKLWYIYYGINNETVGYIKYQESYNLINWTEPVTIERYAEGWRNWHIDIAKINNNYVALVNTKSLTGGKYRLHIMVSPNNVSWSSLKLIMRETSSDKWDMGQLYRSSMVQVDDAIYLYYAAIGIDRVNRVGLTTGKNIYNLCGTTMNKLTLLSGKENSFTSNIKPLDYPAMSIIKTVISNTYASDASHGLPYKEGGIVTTDTSKRESGYIKQTYNVFAKNLTYERISNTDNTWSKWEKICKIVYGEDNITPSMTTGFAKDSITITKITTAYAQANQFPQSKAGELVTDLTCNEKGYTRQTYTIFNSNKQFERYLTTDEVWSDWVSIFRGIKTSYMSSEVTINSNQATTISCPVADAKNGDVVVVTPAVAMNALFSYFAYVPIEGGEVKIILANHANASVTVGNMYWNIAVFKS